MSTGAGRRIVTTIAIVLGFAVAGCGGGPGASLGPRPTPSGAATGVPATSTPRSMVTPGPSAAAELASPSRELPSPASELPPPTPAGPSPCEDARPAPTPRPPDDPQVTGLLTAPGTVGTPGVLGSSTLDGTGSDSPFLPFAAGRVVEISPDVIVTIELGDDSPIDAWAAGLADARDRSGTTLIGLGGRGGGAQPLDSVHLQPLPVGCWVLLVSLHRADGRGSGATYWSISVTP